MTRARGWTVALTAARTRSAPSPVVAASRSPRPSPPTSRWRPGTPLPTTGEVHDFAFAVRAAAETKQPDRRLIIAAVPATQSQEGAGADGGYLVPPDLRADVTRAVLSETSLLGRTDRQVTKSNSILIPADAAPAWATSGTVPTVEPAGAALAQAKLALQGRVLRLNKLQVTLPVSNELFEDASGLAAYLRAVVPARMDFKVNDWLIRGNGVQKPLGFLNAPCKVTQTKEGA